LIEEGYVRHVGLSEAGASTLRRASAIHPVVDLQIEYSLMSRGIEAAILPACRELGTSVTAYGVLSRGLLGGYWTNKGSGSPADLRNHLPRFTGDNLDRNLALVESLRTIASEKRVSVAQLAIAWVLSRGEDIVPLIGARRRDRLAESIGSLDVRLSASDLREIENVIPPGATAGDRYPTQVLEHMDSEAGG
jgi:aryl-alcohol dehydrogenase-like predicted oxidoreductase